jgi:uncharacterized metal-binding protein
MNYQNHVITCLIIAFLSSILGFWTGYLSFQGLQSFWLGIIPYTLFITCDLDSEKSIVRRLWGPFGIIWSPFSNAGHREILHNPAWGPFILVCFLWVPITAYYGHLVVPIESIIGAVLMLETHIVTDKVYSGYRAIVPDWLERKINKIF